MSSQAARHRAGAVLRADAVLRWSVWNLADAGHAVVGGLRGGWDSSPRSDGNLKTPRSRLPPQAHRSAATGDGSHSRRQRRHRPAARSAGQDGGAADAPAHAAPRVLCFPPALPPFFGLCRGQGPVGGGGWGGEGHRLVALGRQQGTGGSRQAGRPAGRRGLTVAAHRPQRSPDPGQRDLLDARVAAPVWRRAQVPPILVRRRGGGVGGFCSVVWGCTVFRISLAGGLGWRGSTVAQPGAGCGSPPGDNRCWG